MPDDEVMVVDQPWITDEREARMKVEGAPVLYTAGGRDPIVPSYVILSYNIPDRKVTSVIVNGESLTLDRRGRSRRVRRRVDPAWAPTWLWSLIEEYRP